MIDLKAPESEKRESRGEGLQTHYLELGSVDYKSSLVSVLADISITLGMILDEMRGIENES